MKDLVLTLDPVLKLSAMKSKMYLLITCFILISSCRNSDSQTEPEVIDNNEEEFSPVDKNIPRADVEEEDSKEETRDTQNENTDQEKTPKEEPSSGNDRTSSISGKYIKTGQETDSNCGCYCIDLNFTSNSELCLVPDQMYINARMQRNNDGTVNVFLVEPSGKNSQGKEIPWKDFDRNSPIAKISPNSNGEIEVDWLGFTINGDLAMDYAIFGKKTLEGNYKKK